MTTEGFIFLGLAVILFFAWKPIFKNTKLSNPVWYGKILATIFIVGLIWMIKAGALAIFS